MNANKPSWPTGTPCSTWENPKPLEQEKKTVTVYVVLHNNYGNQGFDFHGAFSTHKAAEEYIVDNESSESERRWYDIIETEVQ